jgi:hypothetical protein
MQSIAEALSATKLGEPLQFKNMAVFPLFATRPAAPDYVLLGDALRRKLAHVSEVSESGAVPELLFINNSDSKILLVDGEELVGARQNRILNVSILIGRKQKVVVPVSCVEQGRWHYKSRRFESAEHALFAKARAKKMRHVSSSLRRTGTHYANQAEIWSDISAKAAFLGVRSETDAMSDIFEQRATQIEDYVRTLPAQPGQTGALFAVNGKIAGIDLFDSVMAFGSFMQKLVRSYALDAIEELKPDSQVPDTGAVSSFIAAIKGAALERFKAVGEGEDLRFEGDAISGGALCDGDHVVHLCAFPIEKSRHRPIGRGGTIDFEIPAFLRRSYRDR